MNIQRRVRFILARPLFFMADRFTDGVSHYTDLGDWFYHAGMKIARRDFTPKSKHPIGDYRWMYGAKPEEIQSSHSG